MSSKPLTDRQLLEQLAIDMTVVKRTALEHTDQVESIARTLNGHTNTLNDHTNTLDDIATGVKAVDNKLKIHDHRLDQLENKFAGLNP